MPPDEEAPAAKFRKSTNIATQQLTADNLFVLPVVSRYKVREQEYTLVTYKIYSRVDLVDIQAPKFPDFKGFLVQEIDLPQQKRLSMENYKGKNYNTFILRQFLLYPQTSGTLKISPMTCDAVVRIRSQQQVRSFLTVFDTYKM